MNKKELKKKWDELSEKRNLEGAEALAALEQDGRALRYVPESKMTDEVILAAVEQDGYSLRFVPEWWFEEEDNKK